MSRPDRKRLIILRHAKAAWPDVADHDRPLAARGRRDAPEAGRWLLEHGDVPDHVICSTARRTRETLELVRGAWGEARPTVDFNGNAYAAHTPALLDLVRRSPAEASTVLLVGHNPGMQELVLLLTADEPELEPELEPEPQKASAGASIGASAHVGAFAEDASDGADTASDPSARASPPTLRALVEERFPTCALAVLGFDGGWSELEADAADLTDFVVPRGETD